MSLITQIGASQKLAHLKDHLQTPLFKNGYALVTSSLLTSGLGMIYWLLAARLYSAEAIGISSALLSTMMFIVNLAHLNLPNGLNRFVPGAGNKTTRLIIGAYGTAVLISGIASIVFVVGVAYWAPTLAFIKSNPLLSFFFICSTIGWTIFVLQDSALTGLRQAVWIPIENLAFALAKILLLVLVAIIFPLTGVFVSWIIPVFFLLPIINWLIFSRVIPNRSETAEKPKEPITAQVIGRFRLCRLHRFGRVDGDDQSITTFSPRNVGCS